MFQKIVLIVSFLSLVCPAIFADSQPIGLIQRAMDQLEDLAIDLPIGEIESASFRDEAKQLYRSVLAKLDQSLSDLSEDPPAGKKLLREARRNLIQLGLMLPFLSSSEPLQKYVGVIELLDKAIFVATTSVPKGTPGGVITYEDEEIALPIGGGDRQFSHAFYVQEDISLEAVAVGLNLTYPNSYYLTISLVHPNGTAVTLHHQQSGIKDLSKIYGPGGQKISQLKQFRGISARGIWKLLVSTRSSSQGTLNSAKLILYPSVPEGEPMRSVRHYPGVSEQAPLYGQISGISTEVPFYVLQTGKVGGVGVRVKLQYSSAYYLTLFLVHPDGTRVTLRNRVSGTNIDEGYGLGGLTVSNLDSFIDKETAGLWRLVIQNDNTGEGVIEAAQLTIFPR